MNSKKEHQDALKRIDQLMNATSGTPEAIELAALVAEVTAYETLHHSIPEPTKEEAEAFRLEQEKS